MSHFWRNFKSEFSLFTITFLIVNAEMTLVRVEEKEGVFEKPSLEGGVESVWLWKFAFRLAVVNRMNRGFFKAAFPFVVPGDHGRRRPAGKLLNGSVRNIVIPRI